MDVFLPFFSSLKNKENVKLIVGFLFLLLLFFKDVSFGEETRLSLLNFKVTPPEGKISMVAGSTVPIDISFFVPHSLKNVYYINITFVNQSVETGPIFKEDFNVEGMLIIKPIYGNTISMNLNCEQIINGSFVCHNITLYNLTLVGIPPSENLITLKVTSHPGLIPGSYSFNVSIVVAREIGVNYSQFKLYGKVPANQLTFLISQSPDVNISVLSSEEFDASIETIIYLDTFLPKPKEVLLKIFEFLLDEEQESRMNEIRIIVNLDANLLRRVDRDSIDVYRWNGSSWNLLPRNNWRWIDENRIEIATNRLSIWGIFANYPVLITPPTYGLGVDITRIPKVSIKLITPSSIIQRTNSSQIYGFRIENDGEVNLEKVYFEINGLQREWYWLPPQTTLRVNESKNLYFILNVPETDEEEIVFNFTVVAEGYGRRIIESRQIYLKLEREVPIQPVVSVCGNNICEYGENETCPQDCKPVYQNVIAPLPTLQIITGAVVRVIESRVIKYVGLITFVVVLSLLGIKKYNESRKPWRIYEKEKTMSSVLRKLKNQVKKYMEEE